MGVGRGLALSLSVMVVTGLAVRLAAPDYRQGTPAAPANSRATTEDSSPGVQAIQPLPGDPVSRWTPAEGPPPDPGASVHQLSPLDARAVATIAGGSSFPYEPIDAAQARPRIGPAQAAGPAPTARDTQVEAWEISLFHAKSVPGCVTGDCREAPNHPLVYVSAVRWFGPAPDHSTASGTPVYRGIEHWFTWTMIDANTGELLVGGRSS